MYKKKFVVYHDVPSDNKRTRRDGARAPPSGTNHLRTVKAASDERGIHRILPAAAAAAVAPCFTSGLRVIIESARAIVFGAPCALRSASAAESLVRFAKISYFSPRCRFRSAIERPESRSFTISRSCVTARTVFCFIVVRLRWR